ncbi:lysozyme inhibitor LprI family protein [Luteolibacter sp. Populi]|uniref:lysozyme inhibitor LprI family protein n=1 Tax=Luteolibacter sp. Populi TaxID=3230487 RepID=UPI003467BF51
MKRVLVAFLFLTAVLRGDDLSAAKAKFAEQDKALNAAYAGLKGSLAPELFADVQEDQRSWIEYRNFMSEGQARDGEPETSVERWKMAAGLTEERISWLRAWAKLEGRKGWPGSYSDGRGGVLEVAEKGGKFWFSLRVVRGPGFNLGKLRGEFRVNGKTGWFETKAEGEKAPTWLTFVEDNFHQGRIKVFPENAGHFHGMRAYFDGSYLWTGELTADEQKKVIEGDPEE